MNEEVKKEVVKDSKPTSNILENGFIYKSYDDADDPTQYISDILLSTIKTGVDILDVNDVLEINLKAIRDEIIINDQSKIGLSYDSTISKMRNRFVEYQWRLGASIEASTVNPALFRQLGEFKVDLYPNLPKDEIPKDKNGHTFVSRIYKEDDPLLPEER